MVVAERVADEQEEAVDVTQWTTKTLRLGLLHGKGAKDRELVTDVFLRIEGLLARFPNYRIKDGDSTEEAYEVEPDGLVRINDSLTVTVDQELRIEWTETELEVLVAEEGRVESLVETLFATDMLWQELLVDEQRIEEVHWDSLQRLRELAKYFGRVSRGPVIWKAVFEVFDNQGQLCYQQRVWNIQKGRFHVEHTWFVEGVAGITRTDVIRQRWVLFSDAQICRIALMIDPGKIQERCWEVCYLTMTFGTNRQRKGFWKKMLRGEISNADVWTAGTVLIPLLEECLRKRDALR